MDRRATYINIDLTTQDVLRLLESVVGEEWRAGLGLVEAGSDVGGSVCLGADGVEVRGDVRRAVGEGDVLVASALVDGNGDEVAGHFSCGQYIPPWMCRSVDG